MLYLVVVEKGPTSFGAYVPDLPGCIAVGETRDKVLASIHDAIEFHLEGLKEDRQPLPGRHGSANWWTSRPNPAYMDSPEKRRS
jgi:predicted RNase H-like HicB family nuclease